MLDASAIEAINEGTGIYQAVNAIKTAFEGNKSAVALPDKFKIHDLEHYMPNRRHQRGTMATDSIKDFAAYTTKFTENGTLVFVNRDIMAATAVLNMGDHEEPGHCDNTAKLKLTARAEYVALTSIVNTARSQQAIAEFLEDWQPLIRCYADTNEIKTGSAIAAVRNITIEAARKVESEEQQLSATRSSLESVTATSKHTLPTHIYFECEPYAGLKKRIFVLRLGIQTGDKDPRIILRIIKQEEHAQEMAEEFAELVMNSLQTVPVLIGTYTVGN